MILIQLKIYLKTYPSFKFLNTSFATSKKKKFNKIFNGKLCTPSYTKLNVQSSIDFFPVQGHHFLITALFKSNTEFETYLEIFIDFAIADMAKYDIIQKSIKIL